MFFMTPTQQQLISEGQQAGSRARMISTYSKVCRGKNTLRRGGGVAKVITPRHGTIWCRIPYGKPVAGPNRDMINCLSSSILF